MRVTPQDFRWAFVGFGKRLHFAQEMYLHEWLTLCRLEPTELKGIPLQDNFEWYAKPPRGTSVICQNCMRAT